MFKASVILGEIEKNAPLVFQSCKKSISNSSKDLDFLRIDENEFDGGADPGRDGMVIKV